MVAIEKGWRLDLFQRRDIGFMFYWGITMVLRCFPLEFRLKHALPTARLLAQLWISLSRSERSQITCNLLLLDGKLSKKDLSRLIFSHYETHSWNFVVNDLLPHLNSSQIKSFSEVQGLKHLEGALSEGRGVVLLSAHFGAHAYIILAVLRAYGCPVQAVLGQELRPEGNASRFYRKTIDPVRSSPRRALPILERGLVRPYEIAAPLKHNEALLMLGDMHLTERQVAQERQILPILFLWGTATVRTGPMRLPKLLGVPVLPTFSMRRGGRVIVEIEKALKLRTGRSREDLAADLQLYMKRLEQRILSSPDQWGHIRHENIPNWIRPYAGLGNTPIPSNKIKVGWQLR
jgi:lauroyl/myristoyl acyltransferase